MSICVGVCEYEETGRICKGCGRTPEEITEWYYANQERKVEIAKSARKRSKEYREEASRKRQITLDNSSK